MKTRINEKKRLQRTREAARATSAVAYTDRSAGGVTNGQAEEEAQSAFVFAVDEGNMGLRVSLNEAYDGEDRYDDTMTAMAMNRTLDQYFTPKIYAAAMTTAVSASDPIMHAYVRGNEGLRRFNSIIQRCYANTVELLCFAVMTLGGAGGGPASSAAAAAAEMAVSKRHQRTHTNSSPTSFAATLAHYVDVSVGLVTDRLARHLGIESSYDRVYDREAPKTASKQHGEYGFLVTGDLTCDIDSCMPLLASFDATADPGRSVNRVKKRLYEGFFQAPSSASSSCVIYRSAEVVGVVLTIPEETTREVVAA